MSFVFKKSKRESDSQLDCARVLGCMMYIMKCARSNIAFDINKLSRFINDPNRNYMMTIKRVLEY